MHTTQALYFITFCQISFLSEKQYGINMSWYDVVHGVILLQYKRVLYNIPS